MDYVNVLKQTSLALHYVLVHVQEVVTKNRMTFKSVSFMIHSRTFLVSSLSDQSMSQKSSFDINFSHVVNVLLIVPSETLKRNARSST